MIFRKEGHSTVTLGFEDDGRENASQKTRKQIDGISLLKLLAQIL
jgi:hypothetical protein